MVLFFECLGCYSVILVGVSLAPVGDVSVEGTFISFDVDVFVFRVGNAWEWLV
jgi:hypothetical protein